MVGSFSDREVPFDVFISYARPDRAAAAELFAALERRGVRAFYDHESLLPGEVWPTAIATHLARARLTAAIVAESYEAGQYHSKEVIHAVSRGKETRVVPIFLSGRSPGNTPGAFPLLDRTPVFYDELASWDAVAEKLQKTLARDGHAVPAASRVQSQQPVQAILTLTDELWRQVELPVEERSSTAWGLEPRGLQGRWRQLQRDFIDRALTRLTDPAGDLHDPLVVRIEREGVCARLADPRHFLRLDGAPARTVLIGEVGSDRHRVVRLLLETLADSARSVERGTPHFADHLGDLLPVLVSIEDLRTGVDSIAKRLPPELRTALAKHPEVRERSWLILLCPHPVDSRAESAPLFDQLLEDPLLSSCPILLVVHSSARKWLTRGWALVSLAGVNIEAVSDPARRRWLRRCLNRSGAEHLPAALVRDLEPENTPDLSQLAARLIRHALQQQPEGDRPELAAFLLDRTLPAVLDWIHRRGNCLTIGAGEVVDLYRSRPAVFPKLPEPEGSVALLTGLPFLFRNLGAQIAVSPSLLAAYLAARGQSDEATARDGVPSPFDLSVRSFRAHERGASRPDEVPQLVYWIHARDGDRASRNQRIEAVRAIDHELREPLMRSYLAEPLADFLRPVLTEPDVRELVALIDPISRALWAFEELTHDESPEAGEVTALLALIDPGHARVLFALAPSRTSRFVNAASRCLERHLGDLARTRPHYLPAVLVDRLNRPAL